MGRLRRWQAVLAAFAVLSAAVFAYLWQAQSGYFAFLPGKAEPADHAVKVPGERPPPDHSHFYFVAVNVLQANEVEEFWARHFVDGASLVPADQVLAPGQSEQQRVRVDLHAMVESQKVAQVVAERAAGLEVKIIRLGALITAVEKGSPAARAGIRPGDVVVRAQGREVRSAQDLIDAFHGLKPGDPVTVVVKGRGTLRMSTIRRGKRAIIGVGVADAVRIGKLPVRVRFSLPGIGGPSAGLAFALEIYDSLTGRKLLRGHRIAATGELALDGSVHPIGGVKQKTISAIDAGCDTFLVPAGDNARDARKQAGGRIKIVPVTTFDGALRAVRGLPPAAGGA
jgi:Lon-like protease